MVAQYDFTQIFIEIEGREVLEAFHAFIIGNWIFLYFLRKYLFFFQI